jgi:hypothetical protein
MGRFVRFSSVRPAVEVDCSGWQADSVQELLVLAERVYHENLEAVARLEAVPNFTPVMLRFLAKAAADPELREIVRQLLALHRSGRSVAGVDCKVEEVEKILRGGDGHDDERCLAQLESYARSLFAQYQRARDLANQPGSDESPPPSGEGDVW